MLFFLLLLTLLFISLLYSEILDLFTSLFLILHSNFSTSFFLLLQCYSLSLQIFLSSFFLSIFLSSDVLFLLLLPCAVSQYKSMSPGLNCSKSTFKNHTRTHTRTHTHTHTKWQTLTCTKRGLVCVNLIVHKGQYYLKIQKPNNM